MTQFGKTTPDGFVDGTCNMTAIKGKQRNHIEHKQCNVQGGKKPYQAGALGVIFDEVGTTDFSGNPAHTNNADRAIGITFFRTKSGLGNINHALWQIQHHVRHRSNVFSHEGKDCSNGLRHKLGLWRNSDEAHLVHHRNTIGIKDELPIFIDSFTFSSYRGDEKCLLASPTLNDNPKLLIR